jgi:hypothetical protein
MAPRKKTTVSSFWNPGPATAVNGQTDADGFVWNLEAHSSSTSLQAGWKGKVCIWVVQSVQSFAHCNGRRARPAGKGINPEETWIKLVIICKQFHTDPV